MPNYKEMYCLLFNKITNTIDELSQIQQEAEEMYINSDNHNISILSDNNKLPKKKENI